MRVEPYDFRRPSRLPGDLENRLACWFRSGCRLATERWAQRLPEAVSVEFARFHLHRVAPGLEQLPDPAAGYRVAVGAGPLTTLLVSPRRLALALISGLLGDSVAELPQERELTPVEWSLCQYLMQETLAGLQEAWPGAEPPSLQLQQPVQRPARSRLFRLDDNLVIAELTVAGPFGQGSWQWLMSQAELMEQMADFGRPDQRIERQQARPRLEALAQQIPVELSVKLGQAQLPVSDLARLRVGDLVVLNQGVSEPLEASVAGEARYRVWPGRVGSRQAVQVQSLIEC